MSKSKINLNELLKDIDKAFELIKDIEGNKVDLKQINTKAKKLKNVFKNKYSKDLDIEK